MNDDDDVAAGLLSAPPPPLSRQIVFEQLCTAMDESVEALGDHLDVDAVQHQRYVTNDVYLQLKQTHLLVKKSDVSRRIAQLFGNLTPAKGRKRKRSGDNNDP